MNPIGSRKISLQFAVNWLLGIALVGLGLILLFIFGPDEWHPNLVFTAAVLAGAAGLTTAVNNLDQRASQGQQARVHAALECAYRWNSPTLHYCKKAGREIVEVFKTTPSVADQMTYIHSDPARHANLVDVLNWFETLEIAISKNVVDDETARRFFRSVVLEYWHATERFVKQRRVERNNARLLREFECLYERWKN